MQELRQILRKLARTPSFTVIAVLTLAVGIGANSAIYSLLDATLLRPLPYPESERLVAVWETVERDMEERRVGKDAVEGA